MNKSFKVAILGGDVRQISVADFFAEKGYDVVLWGIDNKKCKREYSVEADITAAVNNADIFLKILIITLPFLLFIL